MGRNATLVLLFVKITTLVLLFVRIPTLLLQVVRILTIVLLVSALSSEIHIISYLLLLYVAIPNPTLSLPFVRIVTLLLLIVRIFKIDDQTDRGKQFEQKLFLTKVRKDISCKSDARFLVTLIFGFWSKT